MTPISTILIDAVVQQLEDAVAAARLRKDRLGWFAAIYRQTTRTVGAQVAAGLFDDPERMGRFVTLFAGRYIDPLGAWLGDRPVPRSWRVAFGSSRSGNLVVSSTCSWASTPT